MGIVMELDLLNTPCPINFVRSKLKLDEMQAGETLLILLDDGEAITSVEKSLQEEGHKILSKNQEQDSSWKLIVRKV